MAITKSNKQELLLDHGKPNEKGGCTLATPYALMRSLILDSQITISSLGSCTPLHMKDVSQLNKWARELKWTSRGCIYNPLTQSQPLCFKKAWVGVTGRAGAYHQTCPVSTTAPAEPNRANWLISYHLTRASVRCLPITRTSSPYLRKIMTLTWIIL
jgi:hypothetical protein